MNKINVIDLDNTLIPFDSFLWVLKYHIKKNKMSSLILIMVIVLRTLKLIRRNTFAFYVYKIISKDKSYNDICQKLISTVLIKLNKDVMSIIKKNTDSNTLNILCSASPHDYVKKIADELGWIGYGSFYNFRKNDHLYGKKKTEFIQKSYPKGTFFYNFAISDSSSDLSLLMLFEKSHLLK